MYFEHLSNELILCIWDQLLATDVIFSFCNLNKRITSLLREFCGLYSTLDLRYCTLSICRYFCHQVPNMIEWRLGLTVLKLDNVYRTCPLEMFANEVAKSLKSTQEEKINDISNDVVHTLMSEKKHIQPLFPQLILFTVCQSTPITNQCKDIFLYAVAGGSALRTFNWRVSHKLNHYAKAFLDWLFQFSTNLTNYELTTPIGQAGFELTYEYTVTNAYLPHHSLTNLKTSIANLPTLYILLHYLPRLQHLDIHVTNKITSTDDIDPSSTVFSHPKDLRTLKLRNFNIIGRASSLLEQLVEKFANTLEVLFMSTYHFCNGEIDLCFNGDRLAGLCDKLSQLRTISFAVEVDLRGNSNDDLVSELTKTFSTPFWRAGRLGRVKICVYYHSRLNVIQMMSLPYMFPDQMLFCTTDLIDIKFNDDDDIQQRPYDLSVSLQSIWCNMKELVLSFDEKQLISTTFLRMLQYSSRDRNKMLALLPDRGILPVNAESYVQLTQFDHFYLLGPKNNNVIYNLENLLPWFRLLPNITRLNIDSKEFKYWFINDCRNPHLDSFLQRLTRLFVNCSSARNSEMNEELMETLLSFVIDQYRFPLLEYLRYSYCISTTSVWKIIYQWLDVILNRITEHQLTCVRFDFEKEDESIDLQVDDKVIIFTQPPCIVDIHRRISSNYVSLWMARRQKCLL